jgi:hypothetical protein
MIMLDGDALQERSHDDIKRYGEKRHDRSYREQLKAIDSFMLLCVRNSKARCRMATGDYS